MKQKIVCDAPYLSRKLESYQRFLLRREEPDLDYASMDWDELSPEAQHDAFHALQDEVLERRKESEGSMTKDELKRMQDALKGSDHYIGIGESGDLEILISEESLAELLGVEVDELPALIEVFKDPDPN